MAQYYLGQCFCCREGISDDLKIAVAWFLKAAEGGNIDAQFYLEHCYHEGWGGETHEEKVLKWFSCAAEQGDEQAMQMIREIMSEKN